MGSRGKGVTPQGVGSRAIWHACIQVYQTDIRVGEVECSLVGGRTEAGEVEDNPRAGSGRSADSRGIDGRLPCATRGIAVCGVKIDRVITHGNLRFAAADASRNDVTRGQVGRNYR